jgi:AraC-like DNA-binding protein
MACNDDMGQIVLDICKLAGIHVPEQIAVLGVDDDEFICELTTPPLSSIALNSERSGYEAAELLNQLMAGEKMNGQVIYQEPAYVITRQSTDVMAIDDQDVTQAIRFISEHYTEPIGVEDVASAVHLSRRHLYKKFLSAVGHTVADEIKKKRINHIRKLLLETDWSVYKITMSLRFTGIEHIARYFQKEMGMPPKRIPQKIRTIDLPPTSGIRCPQFEIQLNIYSHLCSLTEDRIASAHFNAASPSSPVTSGRFDLSATAARKDSCSTRNGSLSSMSSCSICSSSGQLMPVKSKLPSACFSFTHLTTSTLPSVLITIPSF